MTAVVLRAFVLLALVACQAAPARPAPAAQADSLELRPARTRPTVDARLPAGVAPPFPGDTGLSPRSVPDATTEQIRLELDVAPRVHVGDSVTFHMRMINTEAHPVRLLVVGGSGYAYRTAQGDPGIVRADPIDQFIVRDPEGRVVWNSLWGVVVPDVQRMHVMRAQDTIPYSATWNLQMPTWDTQQDQPAPPGRYSVEGVILGTPERRTERREFTLTP